MFNTQKSIVMKNTTTISNKKKLVLDFLQDLRDNGELSIPLHRMNLNEWYNLFEAKTRHISNDAIFSDKRFFSLQMNNIAEMNLFQTIERKEERYPIYEVFFDVYTKESDTYQEYNDEFSVDTSSTEDNDVEDDDGKCMLVYVFTATDIYLYL